MASEQTKTGTRSQTRILYPSKYNVVFHNDDFTPMEFVIQILVEVFDRTLEQAKHIGDLCVIVFKLNLFPGSFWWCIT